MIPLTLFTFVKEIFERNIFHVSYIPSDYELADLLTKPLFSPSSVIIMHNYLRIDLFTSNSLPLTL